MCIQHTVILTSLCKWKRPKWLCFFVVKRYAVREAKKWRYAVRKAKIERYAVRKGGRGCHPHGCKTLASTPSLTHHCLLYLSRQSARSFWQKSKSISEEIRYFGPSFNSFLNLSCLTISKLPVIIWPCGLLQNLLLLLEQSQSLTGGMQHIYYICFGTLNQGMDFPEFKLVLFCLIP